MLKILSNLFGSKHDRLLKQITQRIAEINRYFEEYQQTLKDEDFPLKTEEFKKRITEGETIDDLLPEAFGLVKAACRHLIGKKWSVVGNDTVWDMVPYDVQLIGACVLHQGKITEMATGEGKTLVAIMPLYLNALEGRGVHLVTVNDYLAQRDSEWMGGVYKFLGLTVGVILGEMTPPVRRENYACDITYGTNNEFGFDYLRDNMAIAPEHVVQREHHYVIVDEVDSVLIDEARTPLIISGPASKQDQLYAKLKPSVEMLVRSQRNNTNHLITDIENLINDQEQDHSWKIGRKLLKAHRGAPKNKKLIKILGETGTKAQMQQVENDLMRDKKLHVLDEELLFVIDEKQHTIDLTDDGRNMLGRLEGQDAEMFVLPDLVEEFHVIEEDESLTDQEKLQKKDQLQILFADRSERIHNISQLLRAYSLFEKDIEYVVQDGKVMIVDEFTGRLMSGRRYSDGLHQSIEAKEGVKVEGETQTIATITLQNYFRLYTKIAGMTGTAETEEGEFWDIYKLEVSVIPTNEPINRVDHNDVIFKTRREKYNAIIEEIQELNNENLPVLVGTASVEVSETLSRMLRRQSIKHNVLNAKHHKSEADIVKYAGQAGAVTIATNMAGRGTDIKLGMGVVRWKGKEGDKSKAEGGLQIIGTERHESRRIDRQLRGRSGRQGDPGATIFYLSLEDNLMRLFGSERIASIMDRLGTKEGEVITHQLITKSIERAQKRVEAYHFGIRKHLLEYDDVMNQQREVVYTRRRSILFDEDLRNVVKEIIEDYIVELLEMYADPHFAPDQWNQEEIKLRLRRHLQIGAPPEEKWGQLSKPEHWQDFLIEEGMKAFERRCTLYSEDRFFPYVRFVALRVIDDKWKDHLFDMDQMKEGVGLRAYGQKDPLIEYKREGYEMFTVMLDATNADTLRIIFNSLIKESREERKPSTRNLSYVKSEAKGPSANDLSDENQQAQQSGKKAPIRVAQKVGRNDPCPCGSGKKFKNCCGRI